MVEPVAIRLNARELSSLEENMIDSLVDVMKQVRRGEVAAIGIVAIMPDGRDGDVMTTWWTDVGAVRLIAALDILKVHIANG